MANNSQPSSYSIIRAEHRALAAVLESMKMVMARARRRKQPPDFSVLQAMLLYVDEFPERLHHKKETLLLFAKLRARAPELRPVLDQLDSEHAHGEHAIRELEHALLAYQVMGETRRAAFEAGLEQYIRGYLEHMHIEEVAILPEALNKLTADDWRELDGAFGENKDPLTGYAPDDEYAALFQTILEHTPAPIGLAPEGH